jgi:hypothetical protein
VPAASKRRRRRHQRELERRENKNVRERKTRKFMVILCAPYTLKEKKKEHESIF